MSWVWMVRTSANVTDIKPGYVMVGNDEKIDSLVTLWGAGVAPSPVGKLMGVETDKKGSVPVDKFLNPAGHSNVFICGDLADLHAGRQAHSRRCAASNADGPARLEDD